MGFFDWLSGAHNPDDNSDQSGNMAGKPAKKPIKMADPIKSGNVEDIDAQMLNELSKGRR